MDPRLRLETWGTRLRGIALLCFVLTSVFAIWRSDHHSFSHYRWDFIAPYSGARCLLHGCNPYDTAELQGQYVAAHGDPSAFDARHDWHVLTPVYPPTALLLIAPLTVFSYPVAQAVWYFSGAIMFCVGLALLGQLVPREQQWLFLLLACVTLISSNTDLLFRPGNPSTPAIALAALAVWSFFSGRMTWLGVAALFLALALKPHLAAPVWLCLVLQPEFRRRALLSGGLAVALLLGCVAWLQFSLGPAWVAGYRMAMVDAYLPGRSSSPVGPEGFRFLNLQTIVGLWFPSQTTYDRISYAVVVVLFVLWLVTYLRRRGSLEASFLAMAGLLCLSLLPVYHRDYDSRLLVLTLPPLTGLLFTRWRMGALLALASVPLLFCQTTLHMEHVLAGMGNPVLGNWATVFYLRQQTVALLTLALLWPVAVATMPPEISEFAPGLKPLPFRCGKCGG